MKQIISLLTAAVLSTATLNACGQSENGKMSIQEQTEQRFLLNPNPKEAYRIRIKINDAPGPLILMHNLTVRYMARNCSYLISSKLEGATGHPTKRIQPETRRIGDNEYETVFYADAVLDEDYFGEGVCHWQPDGFGTSFKATGKPEETAFNVSDLMETLFDKKTLTKYYWKAVYPYYRNEDGSISLQNNGIENMPELAIGHTYHGSDSLEGFNEQQLNNLFTITVTLEEVK